MVRRREFLQVGLAVSALPVAECAFGHSAVSWGGDVTGRAAAPLEMPLYRFVVDADLPEGDAFAREAARLGTRVSLFRDGDATSLWYDELDPMWREQPLAIAGLTRFGPLFVLERLAADWGMRVLFRGQHTFRPAVGLEHDLAGPASMLDSAGGMHDVGANWTAALARAMARCPADCTNPCTSRIVTPAQRPVTEEPLYSWLIGPRRRG